MNQDTLKEKIKGLLRHPVMTVLAFGLVIGTVTGVLTSNNASTKESTGADFESIMKQLTTLQAHINSMESSSKAPRPEIDLSVIEMKLKELSNMVSKKEPFDSGELTKNIEQRLDQAEQTIHDQLNTLNSAVSAIKNTTHSVKYIPLKALPFSIASIDSIQNIAVASVQYDYKTVPIEKGDVLAGWKVVKVDFSHQQIEFVNKNKEHVLVKQENIG